jgi:hypothetical protein
MFMLKIPIVIILVDYSTFHKNGRIRDQTPDNYYGL